MLVKAKDKETITISFSANVGTRGIKRIKQYISFLETSGNEKTVPQKAINTLTDSITKAAWLKMSKKRLSK